MKISTKILIGLSVFLFSSLFASNLILKNEYNNRSKKDKFIGYQTVLQQPFKHIKVNKSAIFGQIIIQKDDGMEVKVSKGMSNFRLDTAKMFIKNDTLFMDFISLVPDIPYSNTIVYILAPEVLSIEGINATFSLIGFNQKTLTVNLSEDAHVTISNNFGDLEELKVSLSGATFSFDEGLRADKSKIHTIQSVEANLQNFSKLDLGRVDVEALKLNASDNSTVELSGRTLQGFMKK